MNGLAHILVEGEPVYLKFGLPALQQLYSKMKQYELLSDAGFTDLGYAHILYAGYCNWCLTQDMSPLRTFEVFYTYIENADTEEGIAELAKVVSAFESSKYVKALVVDSKKKMTPKQKKKK